MRNNRYMYNALLALVIGAVAIEGSLYFVHAENIKVKKRTAMESSVRWALYMDKSIANPTAIQVINEAGVVTLSGTVSDFAEAESAVAAARSVVGVHKVEEKLEKRSNIVVGFSPTPTSEVPNDKNNYGPDAYTE